MLAERRVQHERLALTRLAKKRTSPPGLASYQWEEVASSIPVMQKGYATSTVPMADPTS